MSAESSTRTVFANADWDEYMRSRPPYPPSLTEIIYDYRRDRPGTKWERVVDIGAGIGVAATSFARDFEIVHLSDPSPLNIDKARKFLSEWAQNNGATTTFEFSQSVGEESYKHTGESQADMVICATAAHFMDPDGLIAAISRILRPGGTLAVFTYSVPTFPDQSDRLKRSFTKVVADVHQFSTLTPGGDRDIIKFFSRFSSGRGMHDSIPIPAEFYADARRIYINVDKTAQDAYGENYPSWIESIPSRVSSTDTVIDYCSGTDPQAKGWSFTTDKEWIRKLLDLGRVFDEECPSGTVRAVWPVNIYWGRGNNPVSTFGYNECFKKEFV
ncbi:S-adenosyl-L-methionine-dependent methyltransferase [Mycena leptocephala]|nr:S-adenosyl-L-methionine-dependent methyltransferase [Mycena leptocephala]